MTHQAPSFAPKDYRLIFGLFIREMPKSVQVRLEPEPKGVAYIPWSAIDSWGPMPSGLPAHYWFMVSYAWLEKAKVLLLSHARFDLLKADVDQGTHPLVKADARAALANGAHDVCTCGHKREQHANDVDGSDCFVRGCECMVFTTGERRPKQGDLFVKREGEW